MSEHFSAVISCSAGALIIIILIITTQSTVQSINTVHSVVHHSWAEPCQALLNDLLVNGVHYIEILL